MKYRIIMSVAIIAVLAFAVLVFHGGEEPTEQPMPAGAATPNYNL